MERLIIGLSGASGIGYGAALVSALVSHREIETHAICTSAAAQLLATETETTLEQLRRQCDYWYEDCDLAAPIASGSFRTMGMVIVPCSLSTVAKLASGVADSLLTRAATVCLKERRRLVVVPRETPLHLIHLEALTTLARAGAVVLPAMPGFYHQPERIDDLIQFIVGKILDQFAIEHECFRRWGEF